MRKIRAEIKEYEKENQLKIRKNNQIALRKKKDWRIKIDRDKQREREILQKFKEADLAKVTVKVNKEDADLIQKIADQARQEGLDAAEIIKSHQQQVEREREAQLKAEEEQQKLEAQQAETNGGVASQLGKNNRNLRRVLGSKWNKN